MTDQQHERCVCGWPAYKDADSGVVCEKCLMRAPNWAAWDRVMRAARLVQEPASVESKPRTIVQIACGNSGLYGLGSDGTFWRYAHKSFVEGSWTRLPDLPQEGAHGTE